MLQFSSSHSVFFFLSVSPPCIYSPCLYSLFLSLSPISLPPFFFPHPPIAFSFFLFSAPHGGPNIFPWGAHFSQTVMNGSGFCIDFQTETI